MDTIRTQRVNIEAQIFVSVTQYLMLPAKELVDRRGDVMLFPNTVAQNTSRSAVTEETDSDASLLLLVDRIQL